MNRWLRQQSSMAPPSPVRPNLILSRSFCAHTRLRWWRKASNRTSSWSWTQAAARHTCSWKHHMQLRRLTATRAIERTRAELEICKPSHVRNCSGSICTGSDSKLSSACGSLRPQSRCASSKARSLVDIFQITTS